VFVYFSTVTQSLKLDYEIGLKFTKNISKMPNIKSDFYERISSDFIFFLENKEL